jgi:hypothetical protein
MRKCVLVVTFWICLARLGAAQNALPIGASVFAEEQKGSGMGQYSISEPSFAAPLIAVDGNGHVYVLDMFNNRVHHYDASGHFIGDIVIPSTVHPSRKEKRKMPLLPSVIPSINAFYVIDGTLYASYRSGGLFNHVLQLRGDKFVDFDADPKGDEIRRKLSPQYRRPRELARLNAERTKAGFPEAILRSSDYPLFVLQDRFHNAWVVDPDYIRVYSSAGDILAAQDVGSAGFAVSNSGELFMSCLYSKRLGCITNFDGISANSVDGVRVMKYALLGK